MDPHRRRAGEVGGHDAGGAAVERERRMQHAAITERHQMLLSRRIRSVKNAERVRTARMRAPYGMRKMRYGVAQPLALRLSVCGRALRALRLQLRRLTRWGTSCQCCRHFGILESDKSRATLFEREDALPVVLHADDEPAVLLRLVVE